MKALLKTDLFRMTKSKLTFVAMILALAFPVFNVLLILAMKAMTDALSAGQASEFFTANSIMSSAYTLTNNLGLVIPAFAGTFITLDLKGGVTRNKLIAGHSRTQVYLSHLFCSMIFSVVFISLYVAVTTILSILCLPFKTEADTGKDVLYWLANGTLSFIYAASIATLFALMTKNTALTLLLTIVSLILLASITNVIRFTDYENYRYAAYLIPTFTSSSFNLNGSGISADMTVQGIMGMLFGAEEEKKSVLFLFGSGSFVLFTVLHTVIGILVFKKKDMK